MADFDYKDLAPVDDVENGEVYLDALKGALQNKRIKNIALAGPYGSGKSSIIETFLRNEREKESCCFKMFAGKKRSISEQSLKISMASFFIEDVEGQDEKKGQEEPGKPFDLGINEIEQGILKQLFYKVEPNEIPQSRYRKRHIGSLWEWELIWFNLLLFTVLFFCWIFMPEEFAWAIGCLVNAGNSLGLSSFASVLFFVMFFYAVAIAVVFKSHKIFERIRIKELKLFADVQVEYNESEGSVFNKHLDEIVYFFEKTGYRIIFFEDLDRLCNSKIFVHLRELNYLLNNDDVIKDKPIVFVYAIRDDILSRNDRTKFFDFIIPVVPIITAANSGDVLLKWLREREKKQEHGISEAFIADISPYIDNMRLLQNIYNEFLIYKRGLKAQQELLLLDEKMMAMVVFKNLYPSDFADIQMDKGIVKQAILDKIQYISRKKSEIQEHIDEYIAWQEKEDQETLSSVKELKTAMLAALTQWDGIVVEIDGESRFYAADIMGDDFKLSDLEGVSQADVQYITYSGSTTNEAKNIKELVQPYISRWKALYMSKEEQKELIQKNVQALRESQGALSSCLMKDLFMLDKGEAIFSNNVVQNKFLVFLLRRGYMDETYADYINYFKGQSVSVNDKNFILSVKNQEGKEFSYPLVKVDRVIQHLQEYEFAHREIYNFSLLEGLLSMEKENQKLNAFLEQLSDEHPQSWQFISEFIYVTKQAGKFIRLLARRWKGMWIYINRVEPLYHNKLNYLALIVENVDSNVMSELNIDNSMRMIFEEHLDILQELSTRVNNPTCINTAIQTLDIMFSNVNIENVPPDVLDYMFRNKHYVINVDMIRNVVAYKEPSLLSDFPAKSYSVIKQIEDQEVMEYIYENLDTFVKEVIFQQESPHDDLEDITELLEELVEQPNICERLIKCEDFRIKNLDSCCGSHIEDFRDNVIHIWDTLLSCQKIEVTWDNIITYWDHANMTEALHAFIETHATSLYTEGQPSVDDAFIQDFITEDFNTETFRVLLPILRMEQFSLNIADIEDYKLEVMIDCDYFPFTTEYYEEVFEKENEMLRYRYILNNQDEFIKALDEISIDDNLFEQLILSQELMGEVKSKVFATYAEEHMSEKIAKNMTDLGLVGSRDVFFLAWEYPLSLEEQKQLMLAHLQKLNADDFEEIFSKMVFPYKEFSKRLSQHHVWLSTSKDDEKLARRLEQLDYISSHKEKLRPLTGPWKKETLGARGRLCIVRKKK